MIVRLVSHVPVTRTRNLPNLEHTKHKTSLVSCFSQKATQNPENTTSPTPSLSPDSQNTKEGTPTTGTPPSLDTKEGTPTTGTPPSFDTKEGTPTTGTPPSLDTKEGTPSPATNDAPSEIRREMPKATEEREFIGKTAFLLKHRNRSRAVEVTSAFLRKYHPNSLIVYNQILHVYKQVGKFDEATRVFQEMKRKGIKPDIFTYNTMISFSGKKLGISGALKVFDEMLEQNIQPTTEIYNTILSLLIYHKLPGDAKKLYLKMKSNNVTPNIFTLTILAQAFESKLDLKYKRLSPEQKIEFNNNLQELNKFYEEIQTMNVKFDCTFFNTLLNTYCSYCVVKEDPSLVLEMMRSMKEKHNIEPDRYTFNIAIKMYCLLYNDEAVDATIRAMISQTNCYPDRVTYNTILTMYSNKGNIPALERTIKAMRKGNIEFGLKTYSNIVSAYYKKKNLKMICSTFKSMDYEKVVPDVNMYNMVIYLAATSTEYEEAFIKFDQMKKKGHVPSLILYNLLLRLCADKLLSSRALQIYEDLKKKYTPIDVTYNHLIELLLKSKLISELFPVLSDMSRFKIKPTEYIYQMFSNVDEGDKQWNEEQSEQLKYLKKRVKSWKMGYKEEIEGEIFTKTESEGFNKK